MFAVMGKTVCSSASGPDCFLKVAVAPPFLISASLLAVCKFQGLAAVPPIRGRICPYPNVTAGRDETCAEAKKAFSSGFVMVFGRTLVSSG